MDGIYNKVNIRIPQQCLLLQLREIKGSLEPQLYLRKL